MNKWNKTDTLFVLKSLAAMALALFIWSFFHQYQINENYLKMSLNEQEAKQKALQYIGSRGWDVSGYTYASNYIQTANDWWQGWNMNYFVETLADKDKNEIDRINKLGGNHRWALRWFKPPEIDEISISFTKDGQLAFFNHIIPDTLAGDLLPQNIALDRVKSFLKTLPNSDYMEDDWKITGKTSDKKPNRIDHYFQWENKHHDFDGSSIRMSLRMKGSEIVRYHRWLEESEKLKVQFTTWGTIGNFFDNFFYSLQNFIAFCSLLIALFYFKIPGNWKLAWKIALFIIILSIMKGALEIPTDMFWFDSEDSLSASIFTNMINVILQASFIGFLIMIIVTAIEKLYRTAFPGYISLENLFTSRVLTSKIYFRNHMIGIVAAISMIALSSIFHFCVQKSGHYIAYLHLDYDDLLSANPLLYIAIKNIIGAWVFSMPLLAFLLLIYHGTKSKKLAIIITAMLTSVAAWSYGINTDPVFIGLIFVFIMVLTCGYLFFRHGLLSLIIFVVSFFLLSDVMLLFFTGESYNVITGVILILLLSSPAIYGLLHYLKFQTTSNVDDLLNSAETIPEVKTSIVPEPELESMANNKWAVGLLIIGLACLFIPNNDELRDIWKFDISRSDAIITAKHALENEYEVSSKKLSGFKITTANWDDFNWRSWQNSMPPMHFYLNKRSSTLAHLKDKVGRAGIQELSEKHGKFFNSWSVRFYKPESNTERYQIKINPSGDKITGYYSMAVPKSLPGLSLSSEIARTSMLNLLKNKNIDLADLDTVKTNMEVIHSDNVNETIRTDHGIEHERQIMLSDSTILNERIYTGISGNKISKYSQYFHRSDDWNRQYGSFHPLFLFCTWGSLTLWILSMVIGMYFLIENSYTNKYEISWKLLIGFILFILILSITHFLNEIPITIARYRGTESYMAFWVEKIGHLLNNYTILIVFMSIAVCSLSLINSTIKNLFSSHNRKKLGHGLLISSMATFGAILLHKPIKYVLYENFPSYLDMSHWFNMNNLSAYFPGYALLLPMIIETLWLSMLSLFFYHKIMNFKRAGKRLKANLLLFSIILFYLIYASFVEQPAEMIPHFLSRLSGVIIYLGLIKYFWKNNPLSHLFGTFIYFQFYKILYFIHIADPTLKIQGWIIIGLFALLFIYTVGIRSIRSSFESRAV